MPTDQAFFAEVLALLLPHLIIALTLQDQR